MSVWRAGRVTSDSDEPLAHDRGLLLGDGLFETVLVTGGEAPLLDRHLARMARSARALRLSGAGPAMDMLVAAAVGDLWRAEGRPARAALRIHLTRGTGRGLTPPDGPSGFLLTFDALPDEAATAPLTAVVVAAPRVDPRDPLAGHKTLSAMARVVARRAAIESGADVAILTTIDGDICEADAANVFAVIGGVVVTPSLDRGVLPGITRARCLEALAAAGRPVAERTLPSLDLARADEAFVTSSLEGVRPLREVDGHPLTAPGPVATWLARCGP
jgi:branched-chain amino acid aminotransferase/4-amino-4-deoxychorismate lyase